MCPAVGCILGWYNSEYIHLSEYVSVPQGNSNSLSSVDLGSGYVGLRAYCPARVALRMGLHAYAGPALAGALLFAGVAAEARSWQQSVL